MSQPIRQAADRPLSPHMQVWRWHITMFSSILHRACLMGLYAGMLLVVGWLAALAAGPAAFDTFMAVVLSPLGLLVLLGLTFALFYNVASTVRHLFWDAGKGFDPKFSELTAWAAIAFAALATAVTWFFACSAGA